MKWATLIKTHGITSSMFTPVDGQECIILKSVKNAKDNASNVEYEDTADTIQMRNNLKQINKTIANHWVDLKITDDEFKELTIKLMASPDKHKQPVDFLRNQLSRIFNNNSFGQGGQFYGSWWQSIPSAYRSRIRINGKKTVELDYSAMHFHMLYAEKGLDIPDGDLYTVDGVDRKKAKVALNITLNAKDKSGAISGIKDKLWPKLKKTEISGVLDRLLKLHEPISKHFFTGKGLYLQFKDSQIAELVMLKMWNKYEVLVLPVHDSFIVPAGFQSALKAEMINAFHKITGVKAKLKPKEPDESLKSELDKLGQREYVDNGVTKYGVNLADVSVDKLRSDREAYLAYGNRRSEWEAVHGSIDDYEEGSIEVSIY